MLKTVLFMVLGVSAGFAFATFMSSESETFSNVADSGLDSWQTGRSPSDAVPLTARIEVLEAALEDEIAKRQSLQADLAVLTEQFADLDAVSSPIDDASDRRDAEPSEIDREAIQARIAERGGFRRNDDPDRRLNQLVEAGFSPDQAQRITERESELRLDALYAQYDAVREGEPLDFRDRTDPQDQLRQELGDASYERYLGATGQSTSVGVQQVMSGSPGQSAGLQPGDDLVAYGGERVYDVSDLNQMILEGQPGETVVVDVIRDGQQIQLYVPRGPIGITGGRGGGMGGR
jgi:hypothetical protein